MNKIYFEQTEIVYQNKTYKVGEAFEPATEFDYKCFIELGAKDLKA